MKLLNHPRGNYVLQKALKFVDGKQFQRLVKYLESTKGNLNEELVQKWTKIFNETSERLNLPNPSLPLGREAVRETPSPIQTTDSNAHPPFPYSNQTLVICQPHTVPIMDVLRADEPQLRATWPVPRSNYSNAGPRSSASWPTHHPQYISIGPPMQPIIQYMPVSAPIMQPVLPPLHGQSRYLSRAPPRHDGGRRGRGR
jgi:hypothetical protein